MSPSSLGFAVLLLICDTKLDVFLDCRLLLGLLATLLLGKKENRNPTCEKAATKNHCYNLWQQINNDQAASRCPVDETDQNKGN